MYDDWLLIQRDMFEKGVEKFELLTAIYEVTIIYEYYFKCKQKLLKLEIDDSVPTMIVSDKARLQKILEILLSNALKFAEFKVDLFVMYRFESRMLTLQVTDDGIGYPSEEI